jgi:hypothetical protein
MVLMRMGNEARRIDGGYVADLVKVWSFEHDAWWRPNSAGYTMREDEAGLYERAEAEEIVRSANHGGQLNEDIVEVQQPSLPEQIAALIREINAQNNRATATPYYFAVQSKKWVDCYHDSEKEVVAYDGRLWTLDEWRESQEWESPEEAFDSWNDQHPFGVRAEWEDKAVFLTEKAASLFMRANANHLTEPRTYVKHFWRNSQMEAVFRALEAFSGEKLIWR